MMPGDKDALKGVELSEGTFRRVWTFARPYRRTIIVFLLAILGAALLALVPVFVIRAIIDNAIPDGDKRQIVILASIAVAAALGDAALAIVQRWASAKVGEGLIYDLRSALFAKIQRMPIAFFTRTPTGSITSRLNNDVIGAQTAVTSTLGSVVSNVIVLVTTLGAMIALEWRLTLLTLVVLPLFIIPARRVGVRLQGISREQMAYNAAMNTQMTERFNVAGASLVKLFGSGAREQEAFERRARGVRDTGIQSALLGRVFFVALGLVAAISTAAIYGIGAFMVVDGSIEVGTLVALAALVTRVYQPLTGLTNARVDLMTSMVSFERVFEVLDAPEAIKERPGAIELVEMARQLAASLLEADEADIVLDKDNGAFHVAGTPAVAKTWADLAVAAKGQGDDLTIDTRFEAGQATFPFGAHVAVVEVDTGTGQVKHLRQVACDDAGRVVNPMLLDGQIHGGIAQGTAQALLEEVRYDEDGNPITSNLAEYGMISATELPSFEVIHMETPTFVNPLGAKGVGESGTIGSTPAVQSAVIDALSHLGIRHIDMPATAEKVWRAIQAAT